MTQLFWGLMFVAVYTTVYRDASTVPLPLHDVITYVWLMQAMFRMLPWGHDPELAVMIRRGDFVAELLRPVDLQLLWYARALALCTVPPLLRAAPMLVLAFAALGMHGPAGAAAFGWFVLALLGAVLLSAAIVLNMTIGLLYTNGQRGVDVVMNSLMVALSGALVPLSLMPPQVATVVRALPFAGLLDGPAMLYLGHGDPWAVLARQAIWLLVWLWVARRLLTRAIARVVVQGG